MFEQIGTVRRRLAELVGDDSGVPIAALLLSLIPALLVGLLLIALGVLPSPAAPPRELLEAAQTTSAASALQVTPRVKDLAQELDRAIASTKENTRRIDDRLDRIKDQLAGEQAALQSMQALLEEMKRDVAAGSTAGAPVGNLEVKNAALQLRYNSWQTARNAFLSALRDLETELSVAEKQIAKTQETAQALGEAMKRSPSSLSGQPAPGDEEAALAAYVAAAESAAKELSSYQAAEADVANTANSLLTEGKALMDAARGGPRADGQPRFAMGFKALAEQIPHLVGEPVENEHPDPETGDVIQRTTRGLMVWRKEGNWTAFTDGSRTWINGPFGLQERDNEQRFPWEGRETSP